MELANNKLGVEQDQAQKRVDRIAQFNEELDALTLEGIVKKDTPDIVAIQDHHQKLIAQFASSFDLDLNTQAKQLSWGMKLASLLGALAMAASLFFLFYQFWGKLGVILQSLVLCLTPMVFFATSLWLRFVKNNSYFAKIAALLSLTAFILNLSMLGQIFNISPSDNALLIWAVFALLLAYSCGAGILLVAAIVLINCFIAARVGTWSGGYWLSFGDRPEHFILPSLLLFFIPSLLSQRNYPGFAQLYRIFAMLGLFISFLILANWGEISYLSLPPLGVEYLYQVLGFSVSGFAIYWGLKKQWNEVVNTGNVFFILFLYTKFFDWWWEWMPKYLFFFVVGLCSLLALLVVKRLRTNVGANQVQGGETR